MGEQVKKLLNDVFYEAKSTKQGVGEASLRVTINDYATRLVNPQHFQMLGG